MRSLIYCDLHSANIYNFNVKKTNFLFSEYSRVDELYSTLDWIAKTTKDLKVTLPINLGDTFHQALRFYVERYNAVRRGVNDINQSSLLKAGVIVEGNHDKTDDISAIDTFKGLPNITVVDTTIKVKFISELNSYFIFVPYHRDKERVKEAFNSLYEKFKGSKANTYVFCHLDIKEAYEGLVTSTYQLNQYNTYDDLHLDIYKAVFSGHLHTRKQIKSNCFYVGSVLNHHFGDSGGRRGIAIVDFEADGYKMVFKENPYCPFFVTMNLQNSKDLEKKIKRIEEETSKYPYTNVYARIFSLNNDEGKKKTTDFIRDYGHLLTAYETKALDSEEELNELEAVSIRLEHINIFDMIVEHGSKILQSQNKTSEEIENYVSRLKKICPLN